MKVIVVNGAAGAGKDSFVQFVRKWYGLDSSILISTVDFVKTIAYECGWDGKKTPENRKFLSDLKNLLTEWDDVPWKKVKSNLKRYSPYYDYAFVMCREPQEIQRFKEEFNAQTLVVRRKEAEEAIPSNSSDANYLNFEYDYIIDNNGSLSDLESLAKSFAEILKAAR